MKTFRYITTIALLFLLGVSANGSSLTADEMVRKMDEHRLFSNNFEMTIRVASYFHNQLNNSTVMKGYVMNGKMTSLTFLEPPNMKGRKILIKDNDVWLIVPNVKKPIRITASQRLMAGISYSDIAEVSYTEGYVARLSGEESIVGMDSEGNKLDTTQCFILELAAKDMATKYSKIIIWAEEQNYLPVKADFFALSGKKMTTVYYTAPREWAGKIILTKMFLFDQINISKHFSMEYSDIKATQTTDSSEDSPKE
jgi:outer membrane lipoprotein-sorting protein